MHPPEKGNGVSGEGKEVRPGPHVSTRGVVAFVGAAFLKALSQGHGSGRQQETRNIFTQKLGVALNRALERRLGKPPCPKDVSKAIDLLAGTKASVFVQHAIRAQGQLAALHAQLQRAQERNEEQATDAVQSTPESSITPQKRSVAHGDTPPRETKRTHVESASPRPRTRTPPPPPPASASDTATNPGAQAPDASMSPKSIPIAPRSMRSDPKFAEIPRAGSPGPQDSPPPRCPVPDTGQPTPPANSKSDSGHQPTLNPQHSKPASPEAENAIPDDRGSSTA
jgi:hypothetical protein